MQTSRILHRDTNHMLQVQKGLEKSPLASLDSVQKELTVTDTLAKFKRRFHTKRQPLQIPTKTLALAFDKALFQGPKAVEIWQIFANLLPFLRRKLAFHQAKKLGDFVVIQAIF